MKLSDCFFFMLLFFWVGVFCAYIIHLPKELKKPCAYAEFSPDFNINEKINCRKKKDE